ncbi:MAG TPA: c-type cytochrome [Anaerolineales bacterium]|nr:c-type cytochrome [Anaerolineales bacterium]
MDDGPLIRRQVFWQSLAIGLGLALSAVLVVLSGVEQKSEWAWYQRVYAEWTGTEADPARRFAGLELTQLNLPDLQRVDRCTSCHAGVTNPDMASAPLPLTQHSALLDSHPPETFGCSVCHAGEGRAVTVAEGHGETPGQHGRLLPARLVASRCFLCHGLEGLPSADTAVVAEGMKLFNTYKCLRCHQIDGAGGSIGPDLSAVASQRNWIEIYAHLLKPDALVPGSTMPDFGLPRLEAAALTAFLLTRLDSREGVRAAGHLALDERVSQTPSPTAPPAAPPGSLLRDYDGRRLFEGLECLVCHRVGLRGGGVGPVLTHIGLARSADWLRDLLLEPGSKFPDGQMPDYELSPGQVDALVGYLGSLR